MNFFVLILMTVLVAFCYFYRYKYILKNLGFSKYSQSKNNKKILKRDKDIIKSTYFESINPL